MQKDGMLQRREHDGELRAKLASLPRAARAVAEHAAVAAAREASSVNGPQQEGEQLVLPKLNVAVPSLSRANNMSVGKLPPPPRPPHDASAPSLQVEGSSHLFLDAMRPMPLAQGASKSLTGGTRRPSAAALALEDAARGLDEDRARLPSSRLSASMSAAPGRISGAVSPRKLTSTRAPPVAPGMTRHDIVRRREGRSETGQEERDLDGLGSVEKATGHVDDLQAATSRGETVHAKAKEYGRLRPNFLPREEGGGVTHNKHWRSSGKAPLFSTAVADIRAYPPPLAHEPDGDAASPSEEGAVMWRLPGATGTGLSHISDVQSGLFDSGGTDTSAHDDVALRDASGGEGENEQTWKVLPGWHKQGEDFARMDHMDWREEGGDGGGQRGGGVWMAAGRGRGWDPNAPQSEGGDGLAHAAGLKEDSAMSEEDFERRMRAEAAAAREALPEGRRGVYLPWTSTRTTASIVDAPPERRPAARRPAAKEKTDAGAVAVEEEVAAEAPPTEAGAPVAEQPKHLFLKKSADRMARGGGGYDRMLLPLAIHLRAKRDYETSSAELAQAGAPKSALRGVSALSTATFDFGALPKQRKPGVVVLNPGQVTVHSKQFETEGRVVYQTLYGGD